MAIKKSKSASNLPPQAHAELAASLEENHFLTMIMDHGRTIGYVFIALVLLLLVIYRFNMHNNSQAEQAYFEADIDFFQLQHNIGNPDIFEDYLTKLNGILKEHPELHAKYDGPIAQALLLQDEPKKAETFASLAFARTKNEESPFFVDYSETTFLIAEGNYQKALDNAINLKQKMINDSSKSNADKQNTYLNVLMTMNLLRIATLQQQIGTKDQELKAWQEFKQYAKQQAESSNSLAFNELFAVFAEGKVTFLDYIEAREKTINN